MAQHNELGEKGEMVAKNFLINKGYHVLQKNWKYGSFELDIIAKTNTSLVVVEVKSRRNVLFKKPEKAVDNHKIKRIVIATQAYIINHQIDLPVRFDIITVVGQQAPYKIEHYENAFYPPIL